MKNRLLYLAVVGLPVLFNSSCAKDDPEPPVITLISVGFSKTALEYVQLTEGTLLMYRDSATSIVDTAIVTKSSLTKILYPEHDYDTGLFGIISRPAQDADHFRLLLTSVKSGTQDAPWFDGEASAYLPYFNISLDNADMHLNESYIDSLGTEKKAPDAFEYWEPYSRNFVSLTIEGTSYNNVIVARTDKFVYINGPFHRVTYYWAKGAGIIKRRIVTHAGDVKTATLVRSE